MPPDPISISKPFMDVYGPFAFGVMALVVIVVLMVWAAWWGWTRMVRPDLEARKVIATKNAEAQISLSDSLRCVERTATVQKEQMELLERILDSRN